MMEGKLVFCYKLADKVKEVTTNTADLNDSKWHKVEGVKIGGR